MIIKKVAWLKFKFNLLKIQDLQFLLFLAAWWYKIDGVWWMILKLTLKY